MENIVSASCFQKFCSTFVMKSKAYHWAFVGMGANAAQVATKTRLNAPTV